MTNRSSGAAAPAPSRDIISLEFWGSILNSGMALCELCHWAFDEGMMGVSDDYNVITSRQISLNPNVPGFLLTLSGRGIIPPVDRDLWPARKYLAEHRREWRL